MRVLVVSLRGQYNHLIRRRVIELGAQATYMSFENVDEATVLEHDCVIIGGGPYRIPIDAEKLAKVIELVRNPHRPILGICLAHHIIAYAYGGVVGPAERPEFGGVEIEVLDEDVLFRGLPRRMLVWESHNDEVKVVPSGFRVLARSENCPVQAMAREDIGVYSVQFHPEVSHTRYGREILANFLTLCRR